MKIQLNEEERSLGLREACMWWVVHLSVRVMPPNTCNAAAWCPCRWARGRKSSQQGAPTAQKFALLAFPGLYNINYLSTGTVASKGISLSFSNTGVAQSGHRKQIQTLQERGLSREPTDFFSLEVSGEN